MKILHINTSDTAGGAAIAAMRLHKAMLFAGIDSTFFCLNRTINDDETILTVDKKTKMKSRTIDVVKRLLFNKLKLSSQKGLFSNMSFGYKPGKFVNLNEYDVIYIHWVNGGFLSFKGLKEICRTGKKVFWFMHDMFPITGGCHHSFACAKYRQNCDGRCLYLRKTKHNLAYKQLKKKHRILDKSNLSFIAPSTWLYECTKASSLAKGHNVYHIPNLLDSNVFHPLDKVFAREVLNLPKDKKIILFGADGALSNPYKGFDYLVESLQILYKDNEINVDSVVLVIFGSSYSKKIEEMLPFKTYFMGYVHDSYTISLLYNAADVFCIPSLAENFANTVLEAVHCHTPVVGFDIGGIPDIVGPDTGYLAKYRDCNDFANGMKEIINKKDNWNIKIDDALLADNIINRHKTVWR